MLRCMAASRSMPDGAGAAATNRTFGTAFNALRSPVALHRASTTLPNALLPTSHKTAVLERGRHRLARLDAATRDQVRRF